MVFLDKIIYSMIVNSFKLLSWHGKSQIEEHHPEHPTLTALCKLYMWLFCCVRRLWSVAKSNFYWLVKWTLLRTSSARYAAKVGTGTIHHQKTSDTHT